MNVGIEENEMIDQRAQMRMYFWVTMTPVGDSRYRKNVGNFCEMWRANVGARVGV